MDGSSDRIEKQVFIKAPRSRMWRAISDAEEFGDWFRANLKGQRFAPGERARGNITYAGYEHIMFDVVAARRSLELIGRQWEQALGRLKSRLESE